MAVEHTLVNDIIVVYLTPFQIYILFVKNVASEHIRECLVKVRLATCNSNGPRSLCVCERQ